jgi:hypothetical protein
MLQGGDFENTARPRNLGTGGKSIYGNKFAGMWLDAFEKAGYL